MESAISISFFSPSLFVAAERVKVNSYVLDLDHTPNIGQGITAVLSERQVLPGECVLDGWFGSAVLGEHGKLLAHTLVADESTTDGANAGSGAERCQCLRGEGILAFADTL
jgi:hypothetical protein